jgi:hypothetical protein
MVGIHGIYIYIARTLKQPFLVIEFVADGVEDVEDSHYELVDDLRGKVLTSNPTSDCGEAAGKMGTSRKALHS